MLRFLTAGESHGSEILVILEGLPAGEYVVEAWHEKLGTQRQTVRTADGQPGSIEFTFPARPGG